MACINIILISLFIFCSPFKQYENEIPSDNYSIYFKIKNSGSTVTGNFKGLKLKYEFDRNKLNTSFFEGSLEVTSIKTGIEMRDRHLKKGEYFNALDFPKITLKTNKIEPTSDGNYKITCNLNIKGISKTVILPATINHSGNLLILKSQFELNRLDFGLGRPSIVMSKNVVVFIDVKLNKNEK